MTTNTILILYIFKFLFWFTIGILFWLFVLDSVLVPCYLRNKIKLVIRNLNYFELFIVILTIFFIFKFIFYMLFNYYLIDYNLLEDKTNYNINNLISDNNSSNSGNSNSSNSSSSNNYTGRPTDGVIITTALPGSIKLAQSAPTLAEKVACVTGSILASTRAIIGKM